jgi:5-(carboxyamino)imidazole ribonucleotide synthase
MSYRPGSSIGILGSGQLGRMLTLAAKRMGYNVHVFSPEADTPAGQVADFETTAAYTDLTALQRFADSVDIVTLEFENIPAEALKALEKMVRVYPQAHVLETTQNRIREKTFLSELGIPVAPFHIVRSLKDLEAGLQQVGCPSVLKTAGFGYDGKGQIKINQADEAPKAYETLGNPDCVLEQFITLDREISIIAARSGTGEFVAYRPGENRHENHILDITVAPAELEPSLEKQAVHIAKTIMEALSMQGLLCVEFFITQDGHLLVNELAPRTHNSGHYTIEATACSQFEMQLRAVCGLPLGNPNLLVPAAAMANLLGDLWQSGEPRWENCLTLSPVYLHLYGKQGAKPGRKMGHITTLGNSRVEAEELAIQARQLLQVSSLLESR